MVRINILSGPMMAPSDSDFLGGGGGLDLLSAL